jgi:PhnB protein
VAFFKKAFGATETYRLMSNGKITHCELRLGDSVLNIGESMDGWPAHGLVAQIYVEDSDKLFKRAVDAGAKEIMPMTDMFFGSREGGSRILSGTCGPLQRSRKKWSRKRCSEG